MVVDVGGGTSEVAVISLGGIVVFESVRVGGYDLDEAIIAHVKQQARHHDRPADAPSRSSSRSARPGRVEDDLTAEVKGRDLVSGLPKTVDAHAPRRCARRSRSRCGVIIETIKDTLERTPPELAADVGQRGIMLAGGGSLLKGFDERVRVETKMST